MVDVIKEVMKSERIKAVRLCRDIGISEKHFSRFINEKVEIGHLTLEKILMYLDLELVKKKGY